MDQRIPESLSKPVEPTKPSVNVPPTTPHTAMATSTPLGTPAANVGKSGRGKSLLLTLLILILLGATGTFAYLWQQGKSAQSNLSQAQADKETAEKKLAEAEAKIEELEGGDNSSNEETAAKNDEIRKGDLTAISSGLEQYYNDNKAFPAAMTDLIAGNYLKEIPTDPRSNNNYSYTPLPNTGPPYTSFTLQATLENQNDKDIKPGTIDTYEVVNKQ